VVGRQTVIDVGAPATASLTEYHMAPSPSQFISVEQQQIATGRNQRASDIYNVIYHVFTAESERLSTFTGSKKEQRP
jgi:hypothetical protein